MAFQNSAGAALQLEMVDVYFPDTETRALDEVLSNVLNSLTIFGFDELAAADRVLESASFRKPFTGLPTWMKTH